MTETTVWMKNGYMRGEIDAATGYPLPGAVPPGIYVVDAEGYRRLVNDPRIVALRETRIAAADGGLGHSFAFAGATVRVATAEQREWFEAREAEAHAKVL